MRGCCGSEAWHRGGSGNSAKESGVSCFVFWRFSVLAFQSFVLVLVQGWVFFGRGLARLEPGSQKHRGTDVLLTNETERGS